METKQRPIGAVLAPERSEALEAPPIDWIPPVVLLALRGGRLHEEDLVHELVFRGFHASRAPRIRRALHEMVAEGLVASGDDCVPLGKCYGITVTGEAYLEAWASSLEYYRGEVGFLLGLCGDAGIIPAARGVRSAS